MPLRIFDYKERINAPTSDFKVPTSDFSELDGKYITREEFEQRMASVAPQPMPMQSYSAPPMEQVETYIETNGDSEFLKAVDGRKADKVWELMDELVEAVKILHPRMYTTFIDKVQDL